MLCLSYLYNWHIVTKMLETIDPENILLASIRLMAGCYVSMLAIIRPSLTLCIQYFLCTRLIIGQIHGKNVATKRSGMSIMAQDFL